mgnify:CR=1 FL=1
MKNILLGFIVIGLFTLVGCGTSKINTSTTTDVDGNTYKTVKIGTQEWMSENLRITKYSDGTPIPNVTDNNQWTNLTTGAWCHYNNNSQHEATYGKLYNWYAVNTNKLCPKGWHVPTDAELTILTDYLSANGHRRKTLDALKSKSDWNYKSDGTSGNGTDDYGWFGLPGGYRYINGNFDYIGYGGYWWSSSEHDADDAWFPDDAWYRGLDDYDDYETIPRSTSKIYGFSVRCLRD